MLIQELLKEIKNQIEEKEIMERVIKIVEKTNDEEALHHCKKILNTLERTLVNDMEYYVNVYKTNEESKKYIPEQE